MKSENIERRDFLKLSSLAASVAVASTVLPRFAWADVKTIKLEECLSMSPLDMANHSTMAKNSMKYVHEVISSISNPAVKETVTQIYNNPAPTIMTAYMDDSNKQNLYNKLKSADLLTIEYKDFLPPISDPNKEAQPFISAPGSGYASHHSYPGGLANHMAVNLYNSLAVYESYKKTYDMHLDRDSVVVSQALHDLHKPFVFQWQKDNSCRTEQTIAGTGEHHILSVAESIKRKIPVHMCIAQACAHTAPNSTKNETDVVGWIKSAAIINDIDPISVGLLDASGSLPKPILMEGFVCSLGDHDWVLSVPAAKWIIPIIKDIATQHYGLNGSDENTVKNFNALRNYIFSQASMMALYHIYSVNGKEALTKKIKQIVAA